MERKKTDWARLAANRLRSRFRLDLRSQSSGFLEGAVASILMQEELQVTSWNQAATSLERGVDPRVVGTACHRGHVDGEKMGGGEGAGRGMVLLRLMEL